MLRSNDTYAYESGTRETCGLSRGLRLPRLDASTAFWHLLTTCKGGYNLTSISKSALAVTRTLIGEMPERIRDSKATEIGIETVQLVAMYQSRFWPSLYPKDAHQGCPRTQVTVNLAKF